MTKIVSIQEDKRITELFAPVNIKTVILVDDMVSKKITIKEFLEKAKALYSVSKKEKLETLFEDSFPNVAILEKKLTKKFEKFSSDERIKYFHKLNEILGTDSQEDVDKDLSSFVNLSEIFHKKVNFHKLTPEDWDKKKSGFFGKINKKNRILVLFDKKLGNGKDSNTYINEIIDDKKYLDLIFCCLFTRTIHTCKDEWSLWENEYKKKYNFYPLAKNRAEDIDKFLHGLKLIILNFYANNLKEKYCKLIKSSNELALDSINNLDINHFDQIIFQSSLKEGILEEDTFVRLYNLFHMGVLIKNIKIDSEIHNITKLIKEINKTKINFFPEHRQDIKDILKNDCYESENYLNGNYIPIAPGDIFYSEDKSYYILLAQPCDMMIRSEGRCISEAILVKITEKNRSINYLISRIEDSFEEIFKISDKGDYEEIKKEELKKISLKLSNFTKIGKYYPLEYFMGKKGTYYIDFSRIYASNLLPLDLCSLNSSGICKFQIEGDYDLKKNISIGFEKHIDTLKRKLRIIHSDDKVPKAIFKESLMGKYDSKEKSITYPIRRIGRLKNPYLSDLLIKFSNHISRIGFEHDLAHVD